MARQMGLLIASRDTVAQGTVTDLPSFLETAEQHGGEPAEIAGYRAAHGGLDGGGVLRQAEIHCPAITDKRAFDIAHQEQRFATQELGGRMIRRHGERLFDLCEGLGCAVLPEQGPPARDERRR
jgi:hypothetical protein